MSVDEMCQCWAKPARLHGGHCCMREAGATCHQTEGMTAFHKAEESAS